MIKEIVKYIGKCSLGLFRTQVLRRKPKCGCWYDEDNCVNCWGH